VAYHYGPCSKCCCKQKLRKARIQKLSKYLKEYKATAVKFKISFNKTSNQVKTKATYPPFDPPSPKPFDGVNEVLKLYNTDLKEVSMREGIRRAFYNSCLVPDELTGMYKEYVRFNTKIGKRLRKAASKNTPTGIPKECNISQLLVEFESHCSLIEE